MHFSSISSCNLGATVTVSATNDTAEDKYLYLPALSNFASILLGATPVPLSAESRIIIPVGYTIVISIVAPADYLETVFYDNPD